jgi:hypothetical protein
MNNWREWQILAVCSGLGLGTALVFAFLVGWLAGAAAGFIVMGSACLFIAFALRK